MTDQSWGMLSSALIPGAPVAQLVRASDQSSEDPGSIPGWISTAFLIAIQGTIVTTDL